MIVESRAGILVLDFVIGGMIPAFPLGKIS